MAPIAMTNIPRANGFKAHQFVNAAPSSTTKRKADESTITTVDSPKKRQKTTHAPRKPAKNPKAASTSTYRPARSATPPNSIVASNALHALAATTIPSPASSVGSSASSNPPTLPSPRYNPRACFTQTVPAPLTPWLHDFPAPTPRFTQPQAACPIDWSKIRGLTQEHMEAYELRAPWNPTPATFRTVKESSRFLVSGGMPSEECVRKRFRNACLAVFKRSGVYFEESAIGLGSYGIPKQNKDLKKLVDSALPAFLPTPVSSPARTARASTTETRHLHRLCHDQSFNATHGKPEETALYAGQVVAVQLQANPKDCPTIRLCDKRLIRNKRALLDYNVTVTQDDNILIESKVPTLPFSTAAFDRWHSSVCFGHSTTFPRREYLCQAISDGEYLLRDNGKPPEETTTLSLMLETYAVSQTMGTRTASNMILGDIVRKLQNTTGAVLLDDDEETFLEHLYTDDPLFDAVSDSLGPAIAARLAALRAEDASL